MKKTVVTLLVLFGIFGLGYGALQLFKANTKKYSPEATSQLQLKDATISVSYCQPTKKGREIFGKLVPYNEVWRTGANEATVFTTDQALRIGGQTLEAGSYSIFTIPAPNQWTVIFNKETGQWGTQYNAEKDVLRATGQVEQTEGVQEILEIYFEKEQPEMLITWDSTRMRLPFELAN